MMPLASELDVRAVLPTIRVPTLVIQHAADVVFLPAWGNDCRRKARRCSFEGCERESRTRGLCGGHYQQLRAGKPLTLLRRSLPRSATLEDRFLANVDKNGPVCPWLGTRC